MKNFLRGLLICMAALSACAFTPNTSTGVFSAVSRRPQPDFQWTWSAQNSQAINVEFQQAVGVTSVLFRLSSPERGPYYLQVNNGVITPGPTSVVWQTLLPIGPSNVPPAQTLPYFAEFLGFGSNNVQKTLAAGRVTVAWSIFNGTNAASFQTANIVYTNVGSFVVSIPSGSVETNHLGTTTMSLFATETAARVAADAALSNRISVASNALAAAVAAETAARVAADAALSNAVATSSNAAVAGVAAETSARTNADASILAQLVAASNSLHAVDVTLSNQIAALTGGGTSVVQETAARIAADAALSNKIDVVSNAFAAADSTTWGLFTAASNSLSTRIDAEAAARVTAVAGVSNSLAITSNSLSTRIDAEVAARIAAVAGVSNSLIAATNAFAVSLAAASNTLSASIVAASNSLAAQITAVNTGLSASAAATSNSLSARIIAASNTLNANIVATSNSMVAQVAAALAKAVTNKGVVINGQALTNGLSLLVGGLATNATLLSIGGTNLPGPLALANSEGVTWVSTATGLAAVVSAAGTFTNLVWNGNANTAQAIVLGESNVVLRYTGGTSYVGLASSITGDLTFNGAINANDHIEIANTKHLRFQDGGGTNTVHLEAVKGRLIITGAVDIVSGQAVPATINGSVIATGTPIYVQSETNAAARLASNVWAAADSTTNYVRRTGDVITGSLTVQTNFFGISKTFSEVFQTAIDHRNSGLFFGAGRSDGGNSAGITIQQRGSGGGAVGIGYSSFGQIYGAHAWFSGLESLDNPVGFNGDFAQINFTAQDGTTSTPFSIRGNWLGGSTATVRVSKIEGDGSGLTGLIGIDSGALTNLGSGLAISAGKLTITNAPSVVDSVTSSNNSIVVQTTTNSSGGKNWDLSLGTYAGSAYAVYETNKVTFNGLVPGYSYNQATQTWVVPAGVTTILVKAWGAGGAGSAGPVYGGYGGFVMARLAVIPGEMLLLYVGKGGLSFTGVGVGSSNAPWGGKAWAGLGGSSTRSEGGGFSGIFRYSISQTNALLIAGGGGGAAAVAGGSGGLTNGGNGGGSSGISGGQGGSQTGGMAWASSALYGGNATNIMNGFTVTNSMGYAGGGGGYYGGGSAYVTAASHSGTAASGGGGSSFVTPQALLIYMTRGNNTGDPDWQSPWGNASGAATASDGAIIIWYNQ